MGKANPLKRIEFLAKRYNVFTDKEFDLYEDKEFIWLDGETKLFPIKDGPYKYALYTFNQRKLGHGTESITNVMIGESVFADIVSADPTLNKEYCQWMLETFIRLIKSDKIEDAKRFVSEDLGIANEYLEIFHREKHRKVFKDLCFQNFAFFNVKDPSNINQYKDLSQLFDAVDPFIIKNTSKLEKDIRVSVRFKEGMIPYEDRKCMVYIPRTQKSSSIFKKFTRWCTTTTRHDYYTNMLTPLGSRSKLYVLIFKTYFLDEMDPNKTNEIYQFHFESKQFMDRSDKQVNDLSQLIKDNEGLSNYFKNELLTYARLKVKSTLFDNDYVKAMKLFKFENIYIDVLPDDFEEILVVDEPIKHLPDLSRFTDINCIYLKNTSLYELNEDICSFSELGFLSVPNNNLVTLPQNIGELKKLTAINIIGNPIKEFPESIKNLDKSKGGALEFISYDLSKGLKQELIDELKTWLPNVMIAEYKK